VQGGGGSSTCDDRAVAAGAMAQTEALALVAAMLQGGPSRWL
jgi:hypothetical protein